MRSLWHQDSAGFALHHGMRDDLEDLLGSRKAKGGAGVLHQPVAKHPIGLGRLLGNGRWRAPENGDQMPGERGDRCHHEQEDQVGKDSLHG